MTTHALKKLNLSNMVIIYIAQNVKNKPYTTGYITEHLIHANFVENKYTRYPALYLKNPQLP